MVRMNECEYIQLSLFTHQVNIFFSIKEIYSLPLFRYLHQVGGHSSMFQYDNNTICKVLEKSEFDFYHSMPEILKKFTPELRGTIIIDYRQDDLGNIELIARSETDDDKRTNQTDQQTNETNNSKKSVMFVLIFFSRKCFSFRLIFLKVTLFGRWTYGLFEQFRHRFN